MLKRDIKDKPGLNIVAFIFMISAAMFMVIGSTLLYALFGGEQKTYNKCNSSDVYFIMDQDVSDKEGHVNAFSEDLENIEIVTEANHEEIVMIQFTGIEFPDAKDNKEVHYSSNMIITGMPDDYDIPIDSNNDYFEVPNGCISVSQVLANRFDLKVGDRVRLTTQMGNVYEFTISTIYKNPAASQLDRMYLSDSDKEVFYSECPVKTEMFNTKVTPGLEDYILSVRDYATDLLLKYEDYHADGFASRVLFINNDGLFAIIVTTCMLVVAVAIMAMTMITIDFSLKSAIKREEREIGMMKAIGVWSLSYKTLFIVKYLFFAVVGGAIGLPLGFLLSKLLFNKFVMFIMYPDVVMMVIIGLATSIATILIIIVFSFFSLRRMNKISVIDAIHGENRGERFTSLPGLSLNRKKYMPVPLFLAISDILRGFKRYLLLILAYMLGICIVLFVVRLNDTIMTTDYAYTYFQNGRLDFLVKIEDSYYQKLYSGTGSFEGAVDTINKNFEDNDIPAKIIVEKTGAGVMKYDGGETVCAFKWRDAASSEIRYLEGNPPKLRNEIAIGYYASNERNIRIGDTVTLQYDKYDDDHITFHKVEESFIVTALVDQFGTHTTTLFMGDDFEGSKVVSSDFFSCKLEAPASQYEDYINKMQALYPNGEVTVMRNKEIMPYYLTGYQQMFRLIITIVSIICAGVLCLLTALYENIFIDEETSDIALLKSMGFSNGSIRAWHFLRLMLLAAFSMGLTYVFMVTGGNLFIGELFKGIMKCGRFKLTVVHVSNFIILPACVITGLAIVTSVITSFTGNIQIWKVRNE
ncbi:MAG: hypothetical protein J6U54_20980 [Clostridiales bacterium]|nr:hypothetical protein [Clostridiales bacterium]